MVNLIAEEPQRMASNLHAKLTSISQQTQARSTPERYFSGMLANIKNLFSHLYAAQSKDPLTTFWTKLDNICRRSSKKKKWFTSIWKMTNEIVRISITQGMKGQKKNYIWTMFSKIISIF